MLEKASAAVPLLGPAADDDESDRYRKNVLRNNNHIRMRSHPLPVSTLILTHIPLTFFVSYPGPPLPHPLPIILNL